MTSVTRAYRGNHGANVNVLKLIRLLNKRIVDFRNLAEFRNHNILGLSEGIQMRLGGRPAALKRFLSIFSDLIFVSRVDPGMPS